MEWSNAEMWLLGGLLLGIAEVFVAGFVLACLAAGAAGGALGAALQLDLTGQILTAALVSTLSFFFLRPVAKKWIFSRHEVKTGVEALVGRRALVSTAFDLQSGMGRCKIDGDDWTAKWDGPRGNLPHVGTQVEIESVQSNTLYVKSCEP